MLSRTKIQKAIKCENWQTLRKALKGESTEKKLLILATYLSSSSKCCDLETRWVQVYNYLNALSRGGFIKPVFSRDLEEGRIEVLK